MLLLALLGVAGVVILVLAILLITRQTSPPPALKSAAASKKAAPARPAAPSPEAPLKEQIAFLMSTIREAQVKKDLSLFMQAYASIFPNRDQKRRDVQKAWQDFDFTAMFFYLEDIKPQGPDAAQAKVVWDMQVRKRQTQEFITLTQTYRVNLVKEQGRWRIGSMEELTSQ